MTILNPEYSSSLHDQHIAAGDSHGENMGIENKTQTKELIEWLEEVEKETRIPSTKLIMIYQLKKEGISFKDISDKVGHSSYIISLLFNIEKYKKWKERRNNYSNSYERNKRETDIEFIKDRSSRNKKWRDKNKDKVIQMSTSSNGKMKLISLLKNEVMKEPTTNIKILWDGEGKWSKENDFCINCNSNIYKHNSNGLCKKCYMKIWRENNSDEVKKYNNHYNKKYYINNKEKLNSSHSENHKFKKAFYDKVKNGDITELSQKASFILESIEALNSKKTTI